MLTNILCRSTSVRDSVSRGQRNKTLPVGGAATHKVAPGPACPFGNEAAPFVEGTAPHCRMEKDWQSLSEGEGEATQAAVDGRSPPDGGRSRPNLAGAAAHRRSGKARPLRAEKLLQLWGGAATPTLGLRSLLV